MITREFSGKTEKEIIDSALDTLKLKEDQVVFDFENKSGIFSFGKKDLTAKVSLKTTYCLETDV